MRKSLLLLAALLLAAAPAMAHKRHGHHHHHSSASTRYSFMCDEWGCGFKARRSWRSPDHCVYKPWKDKTVCYY